MPSTIESWTFTDQCRRQKLSTAIEILYCKVQTESSLETTEAKAEETPNYPNVKQKSIMHEPRDGHALAQAVY